MRPAAERLKPPQQKRKAPQTARGFNRGTGGFTLGTVIPRERARGTGLHTDPGARPRNLPAEPATPLRGASPRYEPFSPSPGAVCRGRGRGGGGRRGFTLVEVMAALTVAGLVLGAAYGIVGAVADARTRTGAERAAALPGPAARAALEGWLRSAAIVEGAGPFVGVRGGGEPPRDALSFTVEDGGALHPGPRRIRLWIERGAGAARTGLLAEVASLRPLDGEPPDTLALAPAAAGLRARYRTRLREQEAWLDAWRSDVALPRAVELAILPAPEAAADPEAGGLPRVLRMPLVIPLRWNPDASETSDAAAGGT